MRNEFRPVVVGKRKEKQKQKLAELQINDGDSPKKPDTNTTQKIESTEKASKKPGRRPQAVSEAALIESNGAEPTKRPRNSH